MVLQLCLIFLLGVAIHLTSECPAIIHMYIAPTTVAIYRHCTNQCLNLALQGCGSESQLVMTALEYVKN